MFSAHKPGTVSRLLCRASSIIATTTLLSPASADLRAQKVATEAVGAGRASEVSSDVRIQRAASLLPTMPPVAIEVVDLRTLPTVLQANVKGSCAFIMKGVARINVLSSCPSYQEAKTSLLSAMQLAAILEHEMAHLNGANEWQARLVELRVFRELLQRVPMADVLPGMQYAARVATAAAAAKKKLAAPHQGEVMHQMSSPDL